MKRFLFGVLLFTGREVCSDDAVSMTLAGVYWRPNTTGLEYARIDGVDQTPTPTFEFGSQLSFRYSPKGEGGDIEVVWTHFGADAEGSCKDEAELFSLCSTALGNQEAIKSNWNLGLNILDSTLGNSFLEFGKLALHPRIGVRYIVIDQTFVIDHEEQEIHRKVEQKNAFQGIGLIGGIDPTWFFKGPFGIFGRFSSALAFGRFHLSKREGIETKQVFFRDIRLFAEASIGAFYASNFSEGQCLMKTTLGLESLVFVDQKRFWKRDRLGGKRERGDLSLKGLFLSIEVSY